MSGGCCAGETPQFEGLSPAYRRALWGVIALNAGMFVVEMVAGISARSQALQADALDFLGDTFTYALSLAVIGRPLRTRANVALFKGVSLSLMGLWVLGSTLYRVFAVGMPEPVVMGTVGILALAANVGSVLLLVKWKDGDANVRSVWLCSRNDAIGNIAVLMAATGVWTTHTGWPDLAVAGIMASLFLGSAFQIVRQAVRERRAAQASRTMPS